MRQLKVLVVSDHESDFIWDYFDAKTFRGVEAIVSCGDLKAEYLTFLVTMINAPLLYVRGNHDARYDEKPPEGCINLEKKPVCVKGVRFLGFGGCKSLRHAQNHYSEHAMSRRVFLAGQRARVHGGYDVLVTHAPAKGLGDGDDGFHEGFACFRKLLERDAPRYYLHGHQHLSYSAKSKRTMTFGMTTIVNGDGYCILDMTFPDERGHQNK